jgi:hypothetical protein
MMAMSNLSSRRTTAPKGGWAAREAWDQVKPLIKKLYVDEDKTLKEVMQIMAREHGHHGT